MLDVVLLSCIPILIWSYRYCARVGVQLSGYYAGRYQLASLEKARWTLTVRHHCRMRSCQKWHVRPPTTNFGCRTVYAEPQYPCMNLWMPVAHPSDQAERHLLANSNLSSAPDQTVSDRYRVNGQRLIIVDLKMTESAYLGLHHRRRASTDCYMLMSRRYLTTTAMP
ncbi:hypothetical protein C7974DRAFT_375690 [Boeremia exigua]|uniref:uncharacterized protein n=1 Tax=Boeremia exigua TaxID=749465 RepID=UPI001E8E3DCF|nr:uncharacterized protein C7974DRAFT_375690 [Boeremia exigua]KAH6633633.1 hypothetical protein C7974DRAFT_375690 [Boeremia exigua]